MLNLVKIQLKMSKPTCVWERTDSVVRNWNSRFRDNEIRFLTVKDANYK